METQFGRPRPAILEFCYGQDLLIIFRLIFAFSATLMERKFRGTEKWKVFGGY